MRAGDLIEVKVGKVEARTACSRATSNKPPLLEGAVVAIDNRTGADSRDGWAARASSGRSSTAPSQAKRQVGSLFKPFVYMAAIDSGYTAASQLEDVADVVRRRRRASRRTSRRTTTTSTRGRLTLRRALELSRNVPAVALMQTLGPAKVIRYPRKLGITTPIPEFLSVAIGAAEGTLLEMTSAYSAFPNQGVRHDAAAAARRRPIAKATCSNSIGRSRTRRFAPTPPTSSPSCCTASSQHGTGANADTAALKWPLGGKTGTTDDYTDAWFIGFDPDITIGVWLGYDQKKPIGDNATGTTAALPIWTSIMKTWVDRRRQELPDAAGVSAARQRRSS